MPQLVGVPAKMMVSKGDYVVGQNGIPAIKRIANPLYN